MSYTAIDPVVSAWVSKHGLFLYTQHQGEEIRSVDVVSPKGQKCQIWIDVPNGRRVNVHAWDYKKRRRDWNAPVERIDKCLHEALETVRSWME